MSTAMLGQVVPGYEESQYELDYSHINAGLGAQIVPGTLNVMFTEDFPLPPSAPLVSSKYSYWPCTVKVDGGEGEGFPGWVIRAHSETEHHPRFLEIISNWHYRSTLRKGNWPSFVVEVSLK